MSDTRLFFLLFCAYISIFWFIGASIWERNGQTTAGRWLGWTLGIIWWIIVLLLPETEKKQIERIEKEIRIKKMIEKKLSKA